MIQIKFTGKATTDPIPSQGGEDAALAADQLEHHLEALWPGLVCADTGDARAEGVMGQRPAAPRPTP